MHSLYHSLVVYGDQLQLKQSMSGNRYISWTEDNFEYVRYNPRTSIDRDGLSLTSLDGGMTGIPDLDSLHQYNAENGTSYEEKDFNVFTEAYNNDDIQGMLKPYEEFLFRTHVIKLNPGGYFPPHRDYRRNNFDSVRLISPLRNICPFLLEEKLLNWEQGKLYFLNTAKEHTLFNNQLEPSYWLVANVLLNENSYNTITDNFSQR